MKRAPRFKSHWIDISVPIHPGLPHWPGDPDPQITWPLRMEEGAECNLSVLSFGSHTGTHMDAPLHFIPGAATLDSLPLDAVIGPARVIALKAPNAIQPSDLHPHKLKRGERILFKTRNSKTSWKNPSFDEHFFHLSKAAAEYLAERKVQTVGIDYLSVGGFKQDSAETHQVLLAAGIWIIEGLDLARVKPGSYDLICLPLRVLGSEGAPARAVLRPRK